MISKREQLRLALTTALVVTSAVTPLTVTAKAIDPALDGRYQQEAEAKGYALTGNGNLTLFHAWSAGQIEAMNGNLCGPYIYETRDFSTTGVLNRLLNGGYKLLGKLQSPFGDSPVSTLQTYLAASIVYLAPPDETSGRCGLILSPLKPIQGETPIPAKVTLKEGWTAGGVKVPAPAFWRWPIYGSWSGSDEHTGTIEIGPFRACGNFLFPYTAGHNFEDMRLNVVRHAPKGDETVYNGTPPINPPDWEQIAVRQTAGTCATYTITGTDDGKENGEWFGLGAPVAFKGSDF